MAITHLPLYIVTAQALIYVWQMLNPDQIHLLMLDPYAVMVEHEYWRLLTFLFIIPVHNPIFAFFFLYLLYIYGSALEEAWDSFSFTIFYLMGVLGTVAAAFLFGGQNGAFFINTTIFLAFAALNPNMELLLFFILPIKVKWLAWLTWAWLAYQIFLAPPSIRAAILVSLANYFLFFGKTHFESIQAMVRSYWHRRKFKDWDR